MSKFIHVSGTDESITVADGRLASFKHGWIFEVPNNYTVQIPVEQLGNNNAIHRIVSNDPVAQLVFR